ncbi:MAG: ABC transporter permease [Sulfobacillus benefaciens]|uniref:ABC transporter permease n=1 Tax=Sulfobacillus benefaciens TaxID=453960 RepID=A0A2T2XKN3_9FIRM|nr:MAG: ABC transporter permease [Sulfobacillus benefaciens]
MHKPLWPALASTVLLASTLAGCGSSASPSSNAHTISPVLNVGNFAAYLPHEILHQFENKYHVHINYSTYPSNAELLAKMQAGQQFDVAVASDYMVQTMIKLGLLDKLNFSDIPNFKNIAPPFRNLAFDPHSVYSVPYLWGTVPIAVNTHEVHVPVTGYRSLLNPAFKDNLVVVDSPRTLVGIALMINGHNLNDTNSAALNQAQQTLDQFRSQVKVFNSNDPHVQLLNGEATAGIVWSGEGALAYSQDPWIVPVFPKSGVNKWFDNFIIPTSCQHKYTAELFINFLLSPKISAELENAEEYSDPNTAADPYIQKSLLTNPWLNPPAWVVDKGEVMTAIPASANEQFNTIWDDFKQS